MSATAPTASFPIRVGLGLATGVGYSQLMVGEHIPGVLTPRHGACFQLVI